MREKLGRNKTIEEMELRIRLMDDLMLHKKFKPLPPAQKFKFFGVDHNEKYYKEKNDEIINKKAWLIE